MDGFEIIRDQNLDKMFEEIIDIFKNVEGVELVRLSGLTNWCRKVSGKHDLPAGSLNNIVRKMRENNVISYDYIINCQHCGETSYIIKYKDDFLTTPKLCDSCKSFYSLIEGVNLEKIKRD